MVQAGQTSVCYDADFYPFGGERDITSTCTQNYKFEGKERDTETGNDDFGARYYTSRLGRWLSADWSAVPAPVPYANLTNPQTLNLYAMVSDNPETFNDLDGHGICDVDRNPCPNSGKKSDNTVEGGTDDANTGIQGLDCSTASCQQTSSTATQMAAQQAANSLSKKGLDFIARHEGLGGKKVGGRYQVYKDAYGNPTIGYGHVLKPSEDFSKGITKTQALALLTSDAQTAVLFVENKLTVGVTQTQFDALTDVAFNSERAAGSLINMVNNSMGIGPADFVLTLPNGYRTQPTGLINRREDEANLFLNGDYR